MFSPFVPGVEPELSRRSWEALDDLIEYTKFKLLQWCGAKTNDEFIEIHIDQMPKLRYATVAQTLSLVHVNNWTERDRALTFSGWCRWEELYLSTQLSTCLLKPSSSWIAGTGQFTSSSQKSPCLRNDGRIL